MNIKEPSALYAAELTVNGSACLLITATPPAPSEGFFALAATGMLSDIYGMIQKLANAQQSISASRQLYRC